jgi:hypothetical protein
MGFKVVTAVRYISRYGADRRQSDWAAHHFTKAIKQKRVNGTGTLFIRGDYYTVSEAAKDQAPKWAAWLAGDYLRSRLSMNPQAPFALVPFPSRSAVAGAVPDKFAALNLANALQDELRSKGFSGVSVADILRYDQRMPSAHEEQGSRDPNDIYPHLRLLSAPLARPTGPYYILVDDTVTTGGHLAAAHRLFLNCGASVWLAVCAVKSVWTQAIDPLAPEHREYPEFEIGQPWAGIPIE